MSLNKINDLIYNIINTINDDTLLVKYIIIVFFGLLLININIWYYRKIINEEIPYLRILRLNLMFIISITILLYLYEIIFCIVNKDLLDQSLKFKYFNIDTLNLEYLLKIIWLLCLFLVFLTSFNFIKKTINSLFSSFFIGINSYLINLWSTTDIDQTIIETYFFKWVKKIDEEKLISKVLEIYKTSTYSDLTTDDVVKWIINNINEVYKMSNNEIENNLIEQNEKKISSYNYNINDDVSVIEVFLSVKNISLILGGTAVVIGVGVISYRFLDFSINFNLLENLFGSNRRVIEEEAINRNIDSIEQLATVVDNIMENNNIAYSGFHLLANLTMGVFNIVRNINVDLSDNVHPRLDELDNHIADIITILENIRREGENNN